MERFSKLKEATLLALKRAGMERAQQDEQAKLAKAH